MDEPKPNPFIPHVTTTVLIAGAVLSFAARMGFDDIPNVAVFLLCGFLFGVYMLVKVGRKLLTALEEQQLQLAELLDRTAEPEGVQFDDQ